MEDTTSSRDAAMYRFMSAFLAGTASAAGIDNGELGRRVRSTFQGICKMIEPSIALEIGAFEAGFSRWMKRAVPTCRTIAFEANPFVFERFKDEVSAVGVEYLNCCVADSVGKVTLNVPVDFRNSPRALDNQMASLQRNLNTKNHRQVEIDAVRVDDFIDPGAVDRLVAWIDVEGACEQVLQGSREVLSRASAVYIEVESSPIWEGQWLDTDVAEFFMDLGFVLVMRDCQRPQQFNLVFVNRELAVSPSVARRAARVYEFVASNPAG